MCCRNAFLLPSSVFDETMHLQACLIQGFPGEHGSWSTRVHWTLLLQVPLWLTCRAADSPARAQFTFSCIFSKRNLQNRNPEKRNGACLIFVRSSKDDVFLSGVSSVQVVGSHSKHISVIYICGSQKTLMTEQHVISIKHVTEKTAMFISNIEGRMECRRSRQREFAPKTGPKVTTKYLDHCIQQNLGQTMRENAKFWRNTNDELWKLAIQCCQLPGCGTAHWCSPWH